MSRPRDRGRLVDSPQAANPEGGRLDLPPGAGPASLAVLERAGQPIIDSDRTPVPSAISQGDGRGGKGEDQGQERRAGECSAHGCGLLKRMTGGPHPDLARLPPGRQPC